MAYPLTMHRPPWMHFTSLRPLFHPTHIGRHEVAAGLDALIMFSAGLAILWLVMILVRGPEKQAPKPLRGCRHVALAVFLSMCGLLLINQLLVNVYILREHGGSASFVTRYLPSGWFMLAIESTPVRWLDAHLPASVAHLLPYTILRVQAVLELPFIISAYLAVTEFLSPALCRALWRSVLLPAALVSFTATFCLIEMALWNPWTLSDLRCRWGVCAAGLLLWGLSRLLGSPAPLPAPAGSTSRLFVLLCGSGALSAQVLGIYAVTLLYNLGLLAPLWPWLLGLTGIILFAAVLSGRAQRHAVHPALSGVFTWLEVFAGLFFVPSLAIRYAGSRPISGAAGLFLAVTALVGAVGLIVRRRLTGTALLGLGVFLVAGSLFAWADAFELLGLPWPAQMQSLEARLLRTTVLFLTAGGAAAALLDSWLQRAADPEPPNTLAADG